MKRYYNRHLFKTFGSYLGVFLIADGIYNIALKDSFLSLNFWIDLLTILFGIIAFLDALLNKNYSERTQRESQKNQNSK